MAGISNPCAGCFPGMLEREMRLQETLEKARDYATEHQKGVEIYQKCAGCFDFLPEGDPGLEGKTIVDRISKYSGVTSLPVY